MIKRYNQFVKEDINEGFEMADPSPITKPNPTTTPDTPTRPRPTRPGVTPTEIPSEEDAPLAYGYEEEEEEEEEEDEYIGNKMLNDLSSRLGVELDSDGSISYKGKKINFYSETEMFHIDKKKFKTVDEVIDYLDDVDKSITPEEEEEMTGERSGERRVGLDDLDDFEEESFESKSYKRTFESFKRRNK